MSTAPPLEPHVRQLVAIAELLLAAAHADGHVSWSERGTIGRVMADFVGSGQLPEVVRDHISRFDPATFDPRAAVAELTVKTTRDRLELLALVSRVVDADAELAGGEAAYLQRVAAAIGASAAEVEQFLRPD